MIISRDQAARIGLALWFGALAALLLNRMAHGVDRSLDAATAATLLAQGCALLFCATILCISLLRPSPVAQAPGWWPRATALLGGYLVYALPLLSPAQNGIALELVACGLILCGNALALVVLLNLGESFSIMAEARRLVTGGPYAIVRHPLYLAEEIGVLGLFLQVASWPALVVLAAQLYFQIARIRNEERVLARAFPEYEAYAARTARLIPAIW